MRAISKNTRIKQTISWLIPSSTLASLRERNMAEVDWSLCSYLKIEPLAMLWRVEVRPEVQLVVGLCDSDHFAQVSGLEPGLEAQGVVGVGEVVGLEVARRGRGVHRTARGRTSHTSTEKFQPGINSFRKHAKTRFCQAKSWEFFLSIFTSRRLSLTLVWLVVVVVVLLLQKTIVFRNVHF